MTCVACDGTPGKIGPDKTVRICQTCKGFGRVAIDGCPRRTVTADVWELLQAHALLEAHGILPVAGGSLDQTACFLDGVAVIDSDLAKLERERDKRFGKAR